MLYQVATAELPPNNIAAPIRRILRRQKNTSVALGEVTQIDPENRRVSFDGGQMMYDVVRKDAVFKDMPIIIATAGAPTNDAPDFVRFAHHPKTLVLRKPLDLPRLEALLAKHSGETRPPAP